MTLDEGEEAAVTLGEGEEAAVTLGEGEAAVTVKNSHVSRF